MKFERVVDVDLFMKSGNVIRIDSVSAETEIIGCDTGVSKIQKFKQIRPKRMLNLGTVDVGQIEGVVVCNGRSKLVF